MAKNTFVQLILAIVIAALLGGAALIIAGNSQGSGGQTPSGFFH